MSNRKTVRPVAGRRVRKLDGSLLAEQGESVVWTSYWLKRLRDGDVECVADAEPEPPEAKPVKTVKAKESSV